mgnify:CR=1 FL=1
MKAVAFLYWWGLCTAPADFIMKYLGFSLEDIREMTINDTDYHLMQNALNLQLKLIDDKIEQMQLVKQAIQDTSLKFPKITP